MKPMNGSPVAQMENLDALGAIKAWLFDSHAHGGEAVLITAIRRETDVELSDIEITKLVCDSVVQKRTPMDVLGKLLRADHSSENASPRE